MTAEAFAQNAVSCAVWPWMRGPAGAAAAQAAARRKALIQSAVMLAVATVLRLRHPVPAAVLVVLAVLSATAGLLAPAAFRAADRALAAAGRAVGIGLGWLLIAPLYYLLFMPVRLWRRAAGRDPLCRRFPEPDTPSFWVAHGPPDGPERYRRQY